MKSNIIRFSHRSHKYLNMNHVIKLYFFRIKYSVSVKISRKCKD